MSTEIAGGLGMTADPICMSVRLGPYFKTADGGYLSPDSSVARTPKYTRPIEDFLGEPEREPKLTHGQRVFAGVVYRVDGVARLAPLDTTVGDLRESWGVAEVRLADPKTPDAAALLRDYRLALGDACKYAADAIAAVLAKPSPYMLRHGLK
jgi:hypothetical protein